MHFLIDCPARPCRLGLPDPVIQGKPHDFLMSAHQARWTTSEDEALWLTELAFPQALCLCITHGTSLHS